VNVPLWLSLVTGVTHNTLVTKNYLDHMLPFWPYAPHLRLSSLVSPAKPLCQAVVSDKSARRISTLDLELQ